MKRRRALASMLATSLALSATFVFAVAASGPGAPPAAAAPASCPGGSSQCVTASPPNCTQSCPVVVAGPTLGVSSPSSTEYVYLTLSNFPVGDSARIAFCPTPEPGHQVTIVSNPLCGYGTYNQNFSVQPVSVPIAANGTAQASFPVPYAPVGETSITSAPIEGGLSPKTFNCDNGPNYCALEVTEISGVGAGANIDAPDTPQTTAIVPVTFFDGSVGCPSSDPVLNTDSSYSLQTLLPAAVESTCKSSGGVVALNTVDDSETTISNFASGGAALAFTDDPADPADAAALKGQSVLYVPVALSASVVGYLGAFQTLTQAVPFALEKYELTPDMVAGIIDSAYGQPFGSDLIPAAGNCKQIVLPDGVDCTSADALDAFDYLDAQASGMLPPQMIGSFMSDSAMGPSAQVTQWLCQQPNQPFTVTVLTHGPITKKKKKQPPPTSSQVTVTDQAAVTTLTTPPPIGTSPEWPPPGHPDAPWIYPTCSAYHVLPDLAQVPQFSMQESPAAQAHSLRGFAYGGSNAPAQGSTPPVGLAVMDWSQATYNGLNVATVQNASGAFVQPSASGVLAALNDATPCPSAGSAGCPAGTYTFNYADKSSSGAYPMPLITYAVVPTSPADHGTAVAIKDLLTNMVTYSHSGGSVPLPSGYVPLPDSLYGQAESEIAKINVPAAPPMSPGRGDGSGSGSGSGGSGGLEAALLGTASGPTGGLLGAALAHELAGASLVSGGHGKDLSPSSFVGDVRSVALALIAGAGRWKYVLLFAGAAVALLVGPTLMVAPRLRRRVAGVFGGGKPPDGAT
jgi:ABC-type phosphate transport system substrate-binding protein